MEYYLVKFPRGLSGGEGWSGSEQKNFASLLIFILLEVVFSVLDVLNIVSAPVVSLFFIFF